MTVDLADLRGWADQVGRAGADCGYLADYVCSFVPDGDFGPVLAPLRADYERLSHQMGRLLALEAARLGHTGSALRLSAADYTRADVRVAHDLGAGAPVTDDGRLSRAFHDTGPSRPPAPVCGGEVLPTVTFGGAFDHANQLLVRVGGPDLRSFVTDHIAGDIGKALSQASVWEHAGRALVAVSDNLVHGSQLVGRSWQGAASTSAGAYTSAWVEELVRQSHLAARVAADLRNAVAQAVDVAQLITDAVEEVVAILAAGWTYASIPIFGQVKAVERVGDVLKLLWDAKKVLAVFWGFLAMVKHGFVAALDLLAGESLPAAPTLPGGAP